LTRPFSQAMDRKQRKKPEESRSKPKVAKVVAIEDIKSSIPEKMKAFEKTSGLENLSNHPDVAYDQSLETITIKGKTYVPKAMTAEQIEQQRHVQKKKSVVEILRKIRSMEDTSKIYEALREESLENVHNAINSQAFSKMAPQHILRSLIYAQKTRLVKVFDSQPLEQAILKVATYIKKLSATEIASFAMFLSKARLLEEV
jgi:hypothetical protein